MVVTAGDPTDGEIWVTARSCRSQLRGSGGAIAYSTNSARIGSRGGFSSFGTGFAGRIYMVAL